MPVDLWQKWKVSVIFSVSVILLQSELLYAIGISVAVHRFGYSFQVAISEILSLLDIYAMGKCRMKRKHPHLLYRLNIEFEYP